MSLKRNSTYAPNYNGRPIMANGEKHYGCRKPILEQIEQQLTNMTMRHNKVLFMRYDVRFSSDSKPSLDNQLFCKLQSDLIKNISRKGLDPQYVAV